MFTQSDVQILVELLPIKPEKLIRQKTMISNPTIKKFLDGKNIRPELAQRIYEAALNVIEENNSKESLLRKKTKQLLKNQRTTA